MTEIQNIPPEQPSRIGPYRIERTLGAGGMGTVYFGRHVETGKEVAVKVLSASLAREEGFVARFSREIHALKKLTNAHVVQLFESGVDGETYYYSMEYVDGETLTDRLRREKRIPWRETIEIAVQVCAALKAAHDAGIIHRDLKPSNLMVTTDGLVKLTDFGVAQVFAAGKLTATGGIIGTAEYMSPEQARGRRATKQSDLYSLGTVMYAMLTGRPPFRGKTNLEVIQKHQYGQFDPPKSYVPEIPRWLDDIVCRLLEKEPDKRFANAYVLSRRFQEVIKKVALSSDERTVVANGPVNPSQSTVAISGGEQESFGPGGGTLMRDLLHAEIEVSQQPSRIGRWFDNVWILIGLLALVIAGGVFWFHRDRMTAEKRFQAGVVILETPESEKWFTARDRYFLPLVEADPEQWRAKVSPYLNRIRLYELQQGFRSGRRRNPASTQSEAERFLRLARHYQMIGDTARAEGTLEALQTVLQDDLERKDLYERTQSLLTDLRASKSSDEEHYAILKSAMDRAALLATQNKPQQARAIWKGVVKLYGPDPSVRDQVNLAKSKLHDNKIAPNKIAPGKTAPGKTAPGKTAPGKTAPDTPNKKVVPRP